jgi:DNA-binding SARP family transcriptional activator
MSAFKEPINKISRPKLSQVFQRKRLFQLLDETRKHPIIWVSGPAGAGKTTLVTSYLESQDLACLWYQIDARDADPATFFYYMSRAVKQARPRTRKPLPLLTPEYMPGLDTFALRYFEALYQCLHAPMVLVIDNYQLIPPESLLHTLIRNGLSLIPDGLTVFLISRESPSPVFSRMLANQKMTHIGWNQIRLTLAETVGIARLQTERSISETTIHHLHKIAGGWAAGLMLMLAQADLEAIDWQGIQGFTPQEILDYFGNEVFESEAPEIQDFLLRVSLLPHMTINMAKTLTGQPRAGRILSELNRRNRFTERRFKERLSYQLHPLFREFLQSRSREKNSENELVKLYRTAAKLLQDEGDMEEAAVLLRNAKAWDSMADLILKYAPTLLHQGRNHTLLEWLGFLPKEMIAKMPWLGYWMGTTLIPFDPEAGRGLLEKAFKSFQSRKDLAGLFLSWSGIVKAIFLKMTDLSPFDHWIQVLEELMAEYRQFPTKEIEGHVVVGMLMILWHRQLHHPNIQFWVDRALSLLSGPLDLNIKVSLINNAAPYFLLTGDYSKAAQLMDLLGASALTGLTEPKGTIVKVAFSTISSHYCCYLGMHAECLETVSKGLEIAKETGFLILNNVIAGYGIWSALIHEEYATARELFEKNAVAMANAGPLDRGLIDFVKSLEASGLGDLKQAAVHATSALKASLDAGSQFSTIFCRLLNARVIHETGKHKEAVEHLNEAFHLSQKTHTRHFMFHALMLEARFALDQGHVEAGLRSLRKAMALGKEIGLYHNVIDSRSAVARLCTIALEHGIEEEYVTEYVRKRCLIPDTPPVQLENWPWPLKIFTLGRFTIVKEGGPIQFSTKAQKKPLEMIKVLIAFGGRDVNKVHISDVLWPDADGDKADQAFATTLHRLRRLLGNDLAVQIQDGKLNLNPSHCWVDCWAFERLLSQADTAASQRDADKAIRLTEKALSTYQGAFLAGDDLEPWAVSRRERLRSRFLLAVNRLGRDLESLDKWEKAAGYYHRSLDIDDLSEKTYQRLMRCLQHLGQKAEALSVYNRCQKTLHAALGLAPSPETQAIYRSLVDKG